MAWRNNLSDAESIKVFPDPPPEIRKQKPPIPTGVSAFGVELDLPTGQFYERKKRMAGAGHSPPTSVQESGVIV